MLTSIERRTSAAVAAAGAPRLDACFGCDLDKPSAMPSSRPVGRAALFFGVALGVGFGVGFSAAGCFFFGGAGVGRVACFGAGAGSGCAIGSGTGGVGTARKIGVEVKGISGRGDL